MAALGYVSQLAIVGFIVLLSAAAISDVRKLTIPNSYCLGIAICYPFFVLAPAQPVDWVALSFVREAEDINGLREITNTHPGGKHVRVLVFKAR